MLQKQEVGKFGETLAKNYLVKHGYKIIDSNVKLSYKEIDIIAKKQDQTIFVEVKTRTSLTFGEADNAMTCQKTKNFKKAVELYINSKNIFADNVRADLISIDIDKNKKTANIKHYQDIF